MYHAGLPYQATTATEVANARKMAIAARYFLWKSCPSPGTRTDRMMVITLERVGFSAIVSFKRGGAHILRFFTVDLFEFHAVDL